MFRAVAVDRHPLEQMSRCSERTVLGVFSNTLSVGALDLIPSFMIPHHSPTASKVAATIHQTENSKNRQVPPGDRIRKVECSRWSPHENDVLGGAYDHVS